MARRKFLPSKRFSIRTLLAVTFLSAICAFFYFRYATRRQAIEVLDNHGFRITHADASEVPFYLRLAAHLGDQRALFPIHEIGNFAELHHPGVIDAVAQLTELKHLRLEYQEEGTGLEKLSELVNVERVTAIGGFVLDDSFLNSFSRLEVFKWDGGELQSDLSVFGQHADLREISIDSIAVKVTDDSFARLCECSQLEKLELRVNVSGLSDFGPILKLKKLKEVRGLLNPDNPQHLDIIARLPRECIVE